MARAIVPKEIDRHPRLNGQVERDITTWSGTLRLTADGRPHSLCHREPKRLRNDRGKPCETESIVA